MKKKYPTILSVRTSRSFRRRQSTYIIYGRFAFVRPKKRFLYIYNIFLWVHTHTRRPSKPILIFETQMAAPSPLFMCTYVLYIPTGDVFSLLYKTIRSFCIIFKFVDIYICYEFEVIFPFTYYNIT